MGRENNEKYVLKDVLRILKDLGFEEQIVKGTGKKVLGKGDHTVYRHNIYHDIKIVIPFHRMLDENDLQTICGEVMIALKILGKSDEELLKLFPYKEGVVGKFRNAIKRPIPTLFTSFVRTSIGLPYDATEEECCDYIEKMKKNINNKHNNRKR